MANKKFNPLEDPPTASSSDEEEVKTLSGEDEEEVEEQISDDSSSEEEDDLMNPVNIPSGKKSKSPSAAAVPAVAPKSESSLSKPGSKKPKENDIRGSPAVKSVKKRPMEITEVIAKRSKKVSEDGEKKIAEETKKPLFQRLWSEEDEISLLQGMIDFKADTGDSPYEDMDRFYVFTRKSISFDASRNQFVDKIRSLKKKYMGKVKKGVESLPKAHDMECLKLSKYIWGSHGMALESAVMSNVKKKPHGKEVEEEEEEELVVALESAAKPNKKKRISVEANDDKVEEDREVLVNGDNVEEDKEVLVNDETIGDREVLVNDDKVGDTEVLVNGKKVGDDKEVLIRGGGSKSLGVRASDWFEDSFLVGSIVSLGASEQFVKQKWNMVAVETKKRMEEKWKLLQAKEMELVLQKTDFMREVGSVIAEAS